MRTASIGVAPEGARIIALAAFATITAALLGWTWITILAFLGTVFCMHFFRDPERVIPQEHGVAVSPADGRVVRIGPAKDPHTGENRTCVCVFMNVFNVHVNRMPVSGVVETITCHPGRFINASLDKASEHNERCVLHLEDENGASWTMVQIAGLVARRIVCRAEAGDRLQRGERFGVIKFGSRVDLYLPDDYRVTVTVGDKVLAGQSILARREMEAGQ